MHVQYLILQNVSSNQNEEERCISQTVKWSRPYGPGTRQEMWTSEGLILFLTPFPAVLFSLFNLPLIHEMQIKWMLLSVCERSVSWFEVTQSLTFHLADPISIHLVGRQIKYSERNGLIKHANYIRCELLQKNTLPLVSLVFPFDCHPASFYLPSSWQRVLLNTHLLTCMFSHNVTLDIDLIYPGISHCLSQPTVGLYGCSMCHCCP